MCWKQWQTGWSTTQKCSVELCCIIDRGGSKGALGTSPLCPILFLFSCSFQWKLCTIIGFRPKLRSWHPSLGKNIHRKRSFCSLLWKIISLSGILNLFFWDLFNPFSQHFFQVFLLIEWMRKDVSPNEAKLLHLFVQMSGQFTGGPTPTLYWQHSRYQCLLTGNTRGMISLLTMAREVQLIYWYYMYSNLYYTWVSRECLLTNLTSKGIFYWQINFTLIDYSGSNNLINLNPDNNII